MHRLSEAPKLSAASTKTTMTSRLQPVSCGRGWNVAALSLAKLGSLALQKLGDLDADTKLDLHGRSSVAPLRRKLAKQWRACRPCSPWLKIA